MRYALVHHDNLRVCIFEARLEKLLTLSVSAATSHRTRGAALPRGGMELPARSRGHGRQGLLGVAGEILPARWCVRNLDRSVLIG